MTDPITHGQARHAAAMIGWRVLIDDAHPIDIVLAYIEQQRLADEARQNSEAARATPIATDDEATNGGTGAEGTPPVLSPGAAEQRPPVVQAADIIAECADMLAHLDGYAVPGTQRHEMTVKFVEAARSLARRWREPGMVEHARQKLVSAGRVMRE